MDEVKQFMDGTYSSWKLDQSDSSEKDLLYIDGKYKTINMSYTFKDGKLKFDGKVTNTDELHFYIPDDIEVCGWSFCGGSVIYDEDNNESGKVYNFSQVEDNHFYLILKMTATDATKRYHFDVDEGLIKGRTPLADIPSAAATVYFQL